MNEKVWITSDIHFNHKNIIKYCGRPYSDVDEMNADIIKRWNKIVGKQDIVWILGDLCFGSRKKTKELIEQLNGRKRLIMGNHDGFSIQNYRDMGFEFVSPFSIIWHDKYIFSHVPMNVPAGYVNVYGHIHNSSVFPTYCRDGICVCMDRWGMEPVLLNDAINGFEFTNMVNSNSESQLKNLCDYINSVDAIEIMKVER